MKTRKYYWFIIIILLILGAIFLLSKSKNTTVTDITPPPVVLDPTASWEMFSGENGITYKYPQTLPTKYISTAKWPPEATPSDAPYACPQGGSDIQTGGRTEGQVINKTTYCIKTESEGAAGSMYTQYSYSFCRGKGTVTLSFTLRFPQCANYNDPEKSVCEAERDSYNVDNLADMIASTLKAP